MRRDMVTFTAFIIYFGFICLLKPTEVALALIQPRLLLSKATDYELTPARGFAAREATRIVCGADHRGANQATSFRPTTQSISWSFREHVSSNLGAPAISCPDRTQLLDGEMSQRDGIDKIMKYIFRFDQRSEDEVKSSIYTLRWYIEYDPTAEGVLLAIQGLSRISMEAKFTKNCRKLAKDKIHNLITTNPRSELSREARSIHFATVELGLRLEFGKVDNREYFIQPLNYKKKYPPIRNLQNDHSVCTYDVGLFTGVLKEIANSKSDREFFDILYAASGEVYKPSQEANTIKDVKTVETQIALKEVCRALARAQPDLNQYYEWYLSDEITKIFSDRGFTNSMTRLIDSEELRYKPVFLKTLVAEVKENSKSPYTWNDIFVRQLEILFHYGRYITGVETNFLRDEQFGTVWRTLEEMRGENLGSIEKGQLVKRAFDNLKLVTSIKHWTTTT